MRVTRALVALSLLTLAIAPGVEAKKAKAVQQQAVPKGNYLDLRNEQFICVSDGCVLPVRGALIGCYADACKAVTDIIVSTSAVKRFVQPQPAAQ